MFQYEDPNYNIFDGQLKQLRMKPVIETITGKQDYGETDLLSMLQRQRVGSEPVSHRLDEEMNRQTDDASMPTGKNDALYNGVSLPIGKNNMMLRKGEFIPSKEKKQYVLGIIERNIDTNSLLAPYPDGSVKSVHSGNIDADLGNIVSEFTKYYPNSFKHPHTDLSLEYKYQSELKSKLLGHKSDEILRNPWQSLMFKPECVEFNFDSLESNPETAVLKPDSLEFRPEIVDLKPTPLAVTNKHIAFKRNRLIVYDKDCNFEPLSFNPKVDEFEPQSLKTDVEGMVFKPKISAPEFKFIAYEPTPIRLPSDSPVSNPEVMGFQPKSGEFTLMSHLLRSTKKEPMRSEINHTPASTFLNNYGKESLRKPLIKSSLGKYLDNRVWVNMENIMPEHKFGTKKMMLKNSDIQHVNQQNLYIGETQQHLGLGGSLAYTYWPVEAKLEFNGDGGEINYELTENSLNVPGSKYEHANKVKSDGEEQMPLYGFDYIDNSEFDSKDMT